MRAIEQALVGRADELARIDDLLAAAADGGSSALLVTGEPGIGKSTLAAAAGERAAERGFGVLRTTGVEADADVPYGGLAELLTPVLDLLAEIPDSQAGALRSALAIDPAGRRPGAFVVANAVLSVLAAAAERRPGLLVLVDDAQWLDHESLSAVLFATRRLHAEGIVVLIGARPEPDRGLMRRGLEHIDLVGLSDDEARLLVTATAEGEEVGDEAMRRIVAASGGNPLALTELPRTLDRQALESNAPIAEPVPPGAAVERAFEAQIASLPDDAVRALVVASADESAYLSTIEAACERLGIGRDALERAEAGGAIAVESRRVRFRHPLLRSVAYHSAPADQRREAHTAIAAALGEGRDESRRAWHLAEATTGPDADVADELEQAAKRAHERGADGAAAHALHRSADLTPERGERARRLAEAGRRYVRAGQATTAVELARSGLALDPAEEIVRATLEGVIAEAALRSGRPTEARDIWIPVAERVAEAAPTGAAEAWLGVAAAERLVGNWEGMRAACERVIALADGRSDALRALGQAILATALLGPGEVDRAAALIDEIDDMNLNDVAGVQPIEFVASPALTLTFLEHFDRAESKLSALLVNARERGAATAVVFTLGLRCVLDARRGRLQTAYADGSEALRLAEDLQQIAHIASLGGPLAEVEAMLGHERDCREHAERAIAILDFAGLRASGMAARAALGLLELGLGRPEAALRPLGECRQAARDSGLLNPNVIQWAANYIESLIRVGRHDDAAAELSVLAGPGGSHWASASAARCRAMLAESDADADALFEASVGEFDDAGMPFEAARSRLCWGERLRRARRRGDARVPLRDALAVFERAGAAPWAARARDELRAAGEAVGAATSSLADELTPHELRIAMLVAQGRTNPEVAAELFNSRKTVEHHLSQIYRKLGVRSRTELARMMAGELGG